jgi:uncharacterized protein YoxC
MMLFYLLLVACAIPMVFLVIDLYDQHKSFKNKLDNNQKEIKVEEKIETEERKDDLF